MAIRELSHLSATKRTPINSTFCLLLWMMNYFCSCLRPTPPLVCCVLFPYLIKDMTPAIFPSLSNVSLSLCWTIPICLPHLSIYGCCFSPTETHPHAYAHALLPLTSSSSLAAASFLCSLKESFTPCSSSSLMI